jgi:periplasmic copper chaperone A
MNRIRRRATAAALTLAAVATAVLGLGAPASAHVTINPKEATQGSYGRFAFRVPNESDTASTTRLEVVLPENAAVGSVSTMPVAGWTLKVEKRKVDPPIEVHGSQLTEAVAKLTWTAAAGGGVKPGEFQEFPVSLGPLPQVDKMVFKVLQTYSDGNVSRWIEEPAAGQAEPEHPAPVLTLTAASGSPTPAAPEARPDGDDDEADDGDDGDAMALGVAGLVAGLAGLILGGLAFLRTRRGTAQS